MAEFSFTTELWEHDGPSPWFFVSLPPDDADAIAAQATRGPGFGAVKVTVTIGGTTWSTSIFPDKARGTYVLPVKKEVRSAEGLEPGGAVDVSLMLEAT